MPWVRFEPDIGKVEESEMAVFLRASKRNETFTMAVEEMTLHDREKMLSLYYESTRVRECKDKTDGQETEIIEMVGKSEFPDATLTRTAQANTEAVQVRK